MKQIRVDQAVILAGGLGTRLKPFTDCNPKPMFPIAGIPFIEHLVRQVKSFGIDQVLILLGYLPNNVKDYLGVGEKYGIHIEYDITPAEYETGARIRNAKDKIHDVFLLMYCDNYCPIDYLKLCDDFWTNNAWIQITQYLNKDGYTKDNLCVDSSNKVLLYDKTRQSPSLQGVDIGYAIINKCVLDFLPDDNCNFEAAAYPKVIENEKMFASATEHRYYSIGSYERIELTKEFFSNRKFVFLDRDGTLNKRPPKACYVEKPEEFEWLPGAIEAVKMLKDHGYTTIVITNQPGIARGNLTTETLSAIHSKMQDDLLSYEASIDAIYYCPHNWDYSL